MIGAITFLWWFSWRSWVGGRGAPGDGGRVGGSQQQQQQQQPPPPPPQFARPSDKLSEIMSEEIGSLARGWLTAGLPASSLPAAPSPFTPTLPLFSSYLSRDYAHVFPDVSLRIDRSISIPRETFFLLLSAFLVPFLRFWETSVSKFQLVFTFYTIGYVSRLCVYYLSFAWNLLSLNFTVFFAPIGEKRILFVLLSFWFLSPLLSTFFFFVNETTGNILRRYEEKNKFFEKNSE